MTAPAEGRTPLPCGCRVEVVRDPVVRYVEWCDEHFVKRQGLRIASEATLAAIRAASASETPAPTAELIAGMISTLNFTPSAEHPDRCLPMARAILAELRAAPPAAPQQEEE